MYRIIAVYLLFCRGDEQAEVLATISQYETGKIHVLSAGLMPPNPAELLGSEHMRRLITTLSSSYNLSLSIRRRSLHYRQRFNLFNG